MRAAISILARTLPFVAALAAALALTTQSTAQDALSIVTIDLSFDARPALTVRTVSPSGGGEVGLDFVSGGSGASAMPAQVSVDLAQAYAATAEAPGTPVGFGFITSASGSQDGSGILILSGTLTADDPARYATDPSAQACAAGPYTGVWTLKASALGFGFTLPVFVEHPAGDASRIELRFCPPPLSDSQGKPVTSGPLPVSNAELVLTEMHGPATRGRYVSSAYVTPVGPAGTPTVEARALEPVPNTLTLKGRYDGKTHTAVLTGSVVQAGKPQARASVQILNTASLTRPKQVRTTARGTFTARVRIAGPTTFAASVPNAVGRCGGKSSAPGGCASLTVTGTNTRSIKVAPRG